MKIVRLTILTAALSLSLVHITLVVNSNYASAQTILWQSERQVSFDSVNVTGGRVFAFGDTIHVFWKQYIGQGNRAYYIRSTDRGMLFSPPKILWEDSGNSRNSGTTQNIVIRNNRIFILWTACDTCDTHHNWVAFRRSTDAGTSFEPYRKLFPAAFATSIAANDSAVVFFWQDRSLAEHRLALSYDDGTTWQNKASWSRNFQRLYLERDDLHLTQISQGTVRPEVAYRYSSNLGTTWSPEIILSSIDTYPSDQMHLCSASVEIGLVKG